MGTDTFMHLSRTMALIALALYIASSCSNPTGSDSPDGPTGSSNARLGEIILSEGSLEPDFDPEITSYTLKIPAGVESIIVTGISEHPDATVGGDSGLKLNLDPRATNIKLTVEAENQTDTTEYRIAHLTELETVHVPTGKFWWDDSGDNIAVITEPYRIGKYLVTQSQFEAVMGFNPSLIASYEDSPARPVERVNWYHAIAFSNRLSLIEGLDPVYSVSGVDFAVLEYDDVPTTENDRWDDVTADWTANGYRLPTQMEWMWAAMGADKDATAEFTDNGANTTGWEKPFAGYNGSNSLGDSAWYRANSDNQTRPVGFKSPNELGIYDMSGNVWEWVWDWGIRYVLNEDETPYPPGTRKDYRGPDRNPDWETSWRVLRGGSYVWDSGGLHFSIRFRLVTCSQERQSSRYGFRVVRNHSPH